MAVRLPVVICQHERRSGRFAEYEEQCITSLLFQQRLDATLISDLATIELHSTDYLCLDGIKGDFVLMTWASPEDSFHHFQRIGFPSWELVPLDGGTKMRSETGSTTKKVYYFPFRLEETVDSATTRLNRLLESLSTPVVSLMLKRPSANRDHAASKGLPVLPTTQISAPAPSEVFDRSSPEPQRNHSAGKPISVSSSFENRIVDNPSKIDDDFPNIDRLVLDLDSFDA